MQARSLISPTPSLLSSSPLTRSLCSFPWGTRTPVWWVDQKHGCAQCLQIDRLKGTFVEAPNYSMGIPNSWLVRAPRIPGNSTSTWRWLDPTPLVTPTLPHWRPTPTVAPAMQTSLRNSPAALPRLTGVSPTGRRDRDQALGLPVDSIPPKSPTWEIVPFQLEKHGKEGGSLGHRPCLLFLFLHCCPLRTHLENVVRMLHFFLKTVLASDHLSFTRALCSSSPAPVDSWTTSVSQSPTHLLWPHKPNSKLGPIREPWSTWSYLCLLQAGWLQWSYLSWTTLYLENRNDYLPNRNACFDIYYQG